MNLRIDGHKSAWICSLGSGGYAASMWSEPRGVFRTARGARKFLDRACEADCTWPILVVQDRKGRQWVADWDTGERIAD